MNVSVKTIEDVNALPLVPGQQILIGRKRLDAIGEALDKIFRLTSRGLAGDCKNETEHILGAMIDLTHQKLDVLLVSFPLGQILGDGDKDAAPIRLSPRGDLTKLQRRSLPSLVRITPSDGRAGGSVAMISRRIFSTSAERWP